MPNILHLVKILRCLLYEMSLKGFDVLFTRYSPYNESSVSWSRCQILSIWWKYYTFYWIRVSLKGFDEFSARYLPYTYKMLFKKLSDINSPISRSRSQILSVRWKCYTHDWRRVSYKSFYTFPAQYIPHTDSLCH